ncbi:MAG: Gmad2 immunoglobulin-like domain-containing protein, partial [Acidimicrobiales bacterium]
MTIRIDQPRAFDLVDNTILVGGVGTGFEANLNYRVHEGHDEVTGFFMTGGGTGEHAQYQLQVDVSGAAFTLDRLFVEVFEVSAEDGSEIHKVIVPVVLGPRIVPGYYGYREH